MNNESLKVMLSNLPESKVLSNLLNNASRKGKQYTRSLPINLFLNGYQVSPEECIEYLTQCTIEDLFCLSALLKFMKAGILIFDFYAEELKSIPSDIKIYMVPDESIVLTIPYHVKMERLLTDYRYNSAKPTFTLEELVEAIA